ncbi:MAG TPA: hypothetical protein V6D11_17960 [Waterburya sp.]|jgi:hypothetical protein
MLFIPNQESRQPLLKNFFLAVGTILCLTIGVVDSSVAITEPKLNNSTNSPVKLVTAANSRARNFTGTYMIKNKSTLDVLILPNNKLKFHLLATYSPPGNPAGTNTGEASGVVPLKGNTAVYQDQDCKITMKFLGGKAQVTQVGNCGFGLRVNAEGTYFKRSNQTPQFDF